MNRRTGARTDVARTLLPLSATAVLLASHPARADDAASRGPPSFGARIGTQSIYLEGDDAPSDLRGYFAGLDAGARLSRHFRLTGVFEASIYDRRSDRLEPGSPATSYAGFLDLGIDTNPEGPWSASIDLATGCRWLRVPLSSGPSDAYGGVEPLRLRLGPALRVDPILVSVTGGIGFGWFTARPGARSCAVTGTCQDSLLDSETASALHFVGDVSVAVRGWP
jgi:hypothetical protein